MSAFVVFGYFFGTQQNDWLGRKHLKLDVALTGRNRTDPPCSVGRPRARRPAGPAAGSVTDDDGH